MLKQRLITAIILVPLVIFSVLKAPTAVVAFLFALIVLAAGWEWNTLMKTTRAARSGLAIALLLLLLPGGYLVIDDGFSVQVLLAMASALWLVLFVAVVRAERYAEVVQAADKSRYVPLGLFVLLFAWCAAVALHAGENRGPELLVYALALVWLADSGAYFAGRRWGKDKLAPDLSPGKTWQGLYGALVTTFLFALAAAWYFALTGAGLVIFVLVSMVAVVFSVIGDLFESWIKRRAGVKDSGHILPGHGGVLDRIDSLLAALPIFAFGLRVFGVMS